MNTQEIQFKVKQIICEVLADRALIVNPDRVKVDVMKIELGTAVRLIFDLCTQTHTIEGMYVPEDWFQALKERWLPKWLKERWKPRMQEIVAEHMFPELAVPQFGKEFVTLKLLTEKDRD